MIRAAAALLLLAPAPVKEKAVHHATGDFDVTITPEASAPAPAGGLPTARMALHKTFTGGLNGEVSGVMLSAGRPAPGAAAAYVAIDQVHGTVDGREGGFVLVHRGTITKAGVADLQVTIAPDTGTGALAGIAGTLTITQAGGKHSYDLAYRLPE